MFLLCVSWYVCKCGDLAVDNGIVITTTGSVYFWVLHYLLIYKADFWICVSPGHREFIDA